MVRTFKLSSGKSLKISANSQRVSTQLLNDYHYAYTITLTALGNDKMSVDDKQYRTVFHDSIYHYRAGKGADEQMLKDAIGSIIADADAYDYNRTLDEFIYEYGYEYRNEARIAFNKCAKAFDWLISHFTRDEIDELLRLQD